MSNRFHQFLLDAYERPGHHPQKMLRLGSPIQIDDQDDNDILTEFCTIFVTVGKRERMEIEITGALPITREIADLAEIYNGFIELSIPTRIFLHLSPAQIDVLTDLAGMLQKTSDLGNTVGNPHWNRISTRTINSLHRFARIVKEYRRMKSSVGV